MLEQEKGSSQVLMALKAHSKSFQNERFDPSEMIPHTGARAGSGAHCRRALKFIRPDVAEGKLVPNFQKQAGVL